MKEVINLLLPLAVAILINISTGTYFKIGKTKIKFSWKIFLQGIFKALIIASAFIGLAYISTFAKIDYAPTSIMVAVITLYSGKAIANLLKIFGLDISLLGGKKVKEDLPINPEVSI